MILTLSDPPHTIRVTGVHPDTAIALARTLPLSVRLSLAPDPEAWQTDHDDALPHYADGTPVPPGDSCGRHWPNTCGPVYCPYRGDRRSRALMAADATHNAPSVHDPGYFGLAVAITRSTWSEAYAAYRRGELPDPRD